MKKKSVLLILTLAVISVAMAQQPIKAPVKIQPQQQLPQNVKLDPSITVQIGDGLSKYEPSATVKYIFYDQTRMAEVTDRTIPVAGDYITLSAMVGSKEYTLVPQNDISVPRSATGIQNLKMVEPTGSAAGVIGVPRTVTVWKVARTGNSFQLTYNGGFSSVGPETPTTGGFLGFQSEQARVAGSFSAISASWQLGTVSEAGNQYIRLQNISDNKFLGYTYSEGRSIPTASGTVRIAGEPVPSALTTAPTGATRGDIKWFYKIYRSEKGTGAKKFPTNVDGGSYYVNIAYANRSMITAGASVAFGESRIGPIDRQWAIEPTSRGTYFIISKMNNKALGINPADNSFFFQAINTSAFYNTDNLQWVIKGPLEGKYTLTPLLNNKTPNTTKVLTCRNGAAVSFENIVGGSYWQEFIIDSINGPLWGYVDMHTHPMSHLAFAFKNFHGAPDSGSLMPAGTIHRDQGTDIGETRKDCNTQQERAKGPAEALGNCNATHGGWGTDNNCGDYLRNGFIGIMESMTEGAQSMHGSSVHGYNPNRSVAFAHWPKWNDMTHQKMWVDWIEMAYQSGLRVMVALAHNNKVMSEIIAYNDAGSPKDDKSSATLQVKEIIDFVGRHRDFMEIAYNSADMYRIIKSNKLAVVPGIELDYTGNFPITMIDDAAGKAAVDAELDRLYRSGVRYIFPIHLSDNAFGGTAIYENLMNIMQKLGTNTFWKMECSSARDSISHHYEPEIDSRIRDAIRGGLPFAPALLDAIGHLLPLPPGIKEAVQPILSIILNTVGVGAAVLGPMALNTLPDNPPSCGAQGHRNSRKLTPLGLYAVKKMMQRGMLIDVDHMSQYAVDSTLSVAKTFNYPVNSGHTGVRDPSATENQRTYRQLHLITQTGGLFGVGWSGQEARTWVGNYQKGIKGMKNRGVCFGSDINSIVFTPKPRPGSNVVYNNFGFPAPQSYGHTWNYNTDGMAHYGMLRDFIRDIRNMNYNNELNVLFSSANEFFLMWQKCERNKSLVR